PATTPGLHYRSAALPSAALTEASRAVGFANVDLDEDNIIRRIPLLARYGDTTLMNTAMAAAWDLAERPPITLEPAAVRFGERRIPTLPDRSFYLWWYRMAERQVSPFVAVSAYDVLKAQTELSAGMTPTLDPATFKDKIVYFGSTATGLFDVKATPLSHVVPGVRVQATALANLLRGDGVRRIRRRTTLGWVVLLCLLTGCITHGTRHTLSGLVVTLVVLAGLLITSRSLLASRHLFIEVVPLVGGVGLTFMAATLINYMAERRHSKLVRTIFEHYLDRSVVRTLINDPAQVKLGGERRRGTVLFSDVADFTNTSEKLEPEELVAFMNLYLDAMTRIIIEEGGFVDKFVGDEIVAIFGAPNDLPDHATCACRAIVRMQQRVDALQPDFRALGCSSDIFFRAGLSTGELIVGNMGSEERMNYTAMGDVMNLGARLESANKQYDTRVLVSDVTAAAADDAYCFRPIDRVRVKGKDQAVPISEFVGAADTLTPEQRARLDLFATGYAHYGSQAWDAAEAVFQQAADQGDAPAAIFITRCQTFRNAPPATDWDGSYTFTRK
ncbi:MAG: adenylate/guanylate cyclase domain-containing protein, partial [Verrucomicrobia bacterium]|nr:adenylate/guanylate cyclase domain-containing protein [Verrucomicrobiota bacterium]